MNCWGGWLMFIRMICWLGVFALISTAVVAGEECSVGTSSFDLLAADTVIEQCLIDGGDAVSIATDGQITSAACCKICTTGKACGNSCISRSYTCHQPPGLSVVR